MAKKRDVIIGVIIAVCFLFAFGFFALIFIGMLTGAGDMGLAGIGGMAHFSCTYRLRLRRQTRQTLEALIHEIPMGFG